MHGAKRENEKKREKAMRFPRAQPAFVGRMIGQFALSTFVDVYLRPSRPKMLYETPSVKLMPV
jgi:hypothetical protein